MSKEQITDLIEGALRRAIANGRLPSLETGRIELDRPKRKEHGDWATNAALAVAGRAKLDSREVARIIVESMEKAPDVVSKVEVAGPGFINFYLTNDFIRNVLFEVAEKGGLFGT